MSTPAITECIRDIAAVLGDIEQIEAQAKSLFGRMGSYDLSDAIENRASIARDELRGIASIVEALETEETRDRQVEEQILEKPEGEA